MFPIQQEFNRPKWDRHEGHEYLPQMFIPWKMIESHNKQCGKNHQQSLIGIAHRGGLGRCEAIAVLEDREWTPIDVDKADAQLKEMVRLWKLSHCE